MCVCVCVCVCDFVELITDYSICEHNFGYFVVTNLNIYAGINVIQTASQESRASFKDLESSCMDLLQRLSNGPNKITIFFISF